MKSLLRTCAALFADAKRAHFDVDGLDRDFVTIQARVKHEGVSFLTRTLPTFGSDFDRSLSEGRWTNQTYFRKGRKSALPRFLSGLLRRVFDDNGSLLEKPDISCIKTIREILYFFKKLGLASDQEVILDRKAKLGFVSVDTELSPLDSGIAQRIRHVTQYLFRGSLDHFEHLEGKHGPGAVSEGYSSNKKWSNLHAGLLDFDPRLLSIGYDLACFTHKADADSEGSLTSSSQSARLISVAKNSTARRTITIEPCLSMFAQQALNEHLRSQIRQCPIMSLSLALTDQSKNQDLALEGSRTGKYATIDLSSASDRLSSHLVRAVFDRFPRFLEAAFQCRSEKVDLYDQPLQKFAGMGNALTFPVQSVAFASICIAAIAHSTLRRIPTYRDVKRLARSVRVYGDDIIIPNEHYVVVSDWLALCGLKVNHNKSFSRGLFRESCGVDAYGGYDVTPVYMRYEPDKASLSTDALAALVSLSNSCWMRGLYYTSNHLKSVVEKFLRRELPLVTSRMECLGWHTRHEAYSFQKWDRNLHTPLVNGVVVSPVYQADPLDGYAALLKFYFTPLLGRTVGHLQRSVRRFTVKHRSRWVQCR